MCKNQSKYKNTAFRMFAIQNWINLLKKALQKRKSCKFPFVYKQIIFNACTTLDSEDGTPWCSTKVDQRTRKHIEREGAYGECLNDTCKIVPFSNANETSLLSAE